MEVGRGLDSTFSKIIAQSSLSGLFSSTGDANMGVQVPATNSWYWTNVQLVQVKHTDRGRVSTVLTMPFFVLHPLYLADCLSGSLHANLSLPVPPVLASYYPSNPLPRPSKPLALSPWSLAFLFALPSWSHSTSNIGR